MHGLTHILVVGSYALVAALSGFALTQALPGLPSHVSYLIAAAGFLAAALAHEALTRRQGMREIEEQLDGAFDEIDSLRAFSRDLLQDLGRAREEMALLCEVVEEAADGANQTMVREMRVLQQQLGHLSSASADHGMTTKPRHRPQRPAAAEPEQAEEGDGDGGTLPLAAMDEDLMLEVIRDALNANRVELYVQPVVRLPQRKIRFYEAMSRLRTRENRLLMPDHYLSLAEEAGLVATIDNLLLLRCVQLLRRVENRRDPISFFVNISPHTLTDAEFMSQFVDFLESNRELAGRIIFEFAQRDMAGVGEAVQTQLRRLSRFGFHFSMDQVEHLDLDPNGLADMRFRYVKIPARLLISDPRRVGAHVDPQDLRDLLDRADIELIVDKIETENHVIEVLDFDPVYGQGYLFGEPRPIREEAQAA